MTMPKLSMTRRDAISALGAAAFAGATGTTALAQSAPTTRKIAVRPHQIVERVAEFMANRDLEGVVSMFHPDVRIALDPDNAEPVVGHDAVREIFAGPCEARAILKARVTGEMINGDMALLQGDWTMEGQDGTPMGGGTSTEVAKQLPNGGWTYFIDCPISVPKPVRG
ncbi:nuclear transport factor 2 family protein [Ruegeria sp. ANG10]|uniref:YybH family protein n=1 Tax=Ruegeria sp. ANG10 TaxID=3042467 RepID=UPI003452DFF5